MKQAKFLPVLMLVLCLPGVVVRALHLLNGFDIGTGLPAVGDSWVWYFTALLVLAAVIYAVLCVPLRKANTLSFEQLLGTQHPLFRMAAVLSGLLIIVGGLAYFYLTMTTGEEDAAGWAKLLEIVYAVVSVLCGVCAIGLAKAQGSEMTSQSAKLTLVPLLWSCLHLLVNYRMTCVDPKLASFAFGLVADVILVLAFYYLARLLYGKPRPALFAFFSAVTTTMAVSDLGGYGLSRLMGVTTPEWSEKMILRGCLSVVACILLVAELFVLCRDHAADVQE